MNFSEIFIRRPIATSLLMFAIALFGVVSYRALPVADLPSVDFPALSVSASLPGASPATMAASVATPLERQFSSISGIDSMTSVSTLGSTSISLQFDLTRNIDGAAVDLVTAINAATPLLPPGMPSPPSFRKSNPSDSPVAIMGLTSATLPLWVLNDYAESLVAQRISTINGVAQVNVFGSQKFAVHVQVDPGKLASRQIGINEVAQALQDWNVNMPTGTLAGPHYSYNIKASGQLVNASDYKPVTVAWRNGKPVRLEEVANVMDSVEDQRSVSWLYNPEGGVRATSLFVMRQPGSNVIEVVDEIKKLIPVFNSQLPPSAQLFMRGDRAKTIRDAFHDMQFTMGITVAMVIGVIFMFLRNASATLIPSVALPVSIVGTFSIMYVLDYSLDNLSMMALILSVGFVVDDAIVMLENIVRHLERGETRMQAALNGSREVVFTIVSMTLSLAAVFIPVLFMGGILGRLFREFAVTICVAILISGLVSITLTPMLCSLFLKAPKHHRDGRLYTLLMRFYDWTLLWVLRHRLTVCVIFLAVLGGTYYLYDIVPKGFIPDQDNDQMYVNTEAAQGTSFQEMAALTQRVAEILRRDPNIESFQASAGGGSSGPGPSSGNTGRMYVQLVPRANRKLTSAQVIEQLRPKVANIPNMRVFMNLPQSIRIGSRSSKSNYELTLQAPDTSDLYSEGEKLQKLIAQLPAVNDVTSDLQLRNPRVKIEIDRDKAASLGLNAQDIQSALYQGFGPSWVSTIYAPNAQYKVLLELLPQYQEHPDSLSLLYLKSPQQGSLVPLSAVTKVGRDAGPLTINHSGQLPSVTIAFNLRPGFALGDAVGQVKEVADRTLPPHMAASFTGTAQAFQSSLKNLTLLIIVAILVVYIVLGVLYESYVHPITILSGLPSAGFGALLTLLFFKVELSIYAFVGLMMLVGIVKKNAIMQIDFARDAERAGKSPRDAIYEGCLVRFRPIMMTTMAAMLGALPMAVGYGAGHEARRPLGLTVVGGLFFSQLMTLYLTPVVYTYLSQFTEFLTKLKTRTGRGQLAHVES
ncbi:MAG TPA: efflux RND transporter permease subunit [Bryobacteraceae bacterium]|nr:efflux RND transporter permease subunit [Bryobacteraceae bacterium]